MESDIRHKLKAKKNLDQNQPANLVDDEGDIDQKFMGKYVKSEIPLIQVKLTHSQIGSLIPSLARSRFSAYGTLDPLCRDFVVALSTDIYKNINDPRYLKFLLEKLISLNYHKVTNRSQETILNAQIFFEQVLEMLTLKRGQILSENEEDQPKIKEQIETLTLIENYCNLGLTNLAAAIYENNSEMPLVDNSRLKPEDLQLKVDGADDIPLKTDRKEEVLLSNQ